MTIRLDDPVRDLVNYCVEPIEFHMEKPWNRMTFFQKTEHLFATLAMCCPDDDICNLGASAYLLAALDRPKLAAEKLNRAGMLNLERET